MSDSLRMVKSLKKVRILSKPTKPEVTQRDK